MGRHWEHGSDRGRESKRGKKYSKKKFELMAKIRVAAGAWLTEN